MGTHANAALATTRAILVSQRANNFVISVCYRKRRGQGRSRRHLVVSPAMRWRKRTWKSGAGGVEGLNAAGGTSAID